MKNKLRKFAVSSIGFTVIIAVLSFLFLSVAFAQPQTPIETTVKKVIESLPYSMIRFEADDKLSLEPGRCKCRPCCGTITNWAQYYEAVTKEKMSLLTEIKLK